VVGAQPGGDEEHVADGMAHAHPPVEAKRPTHHRVGLLGTSEFHQGEGGVVQGRELLHDAQLVVQIDHREVGGERLSRSPWLMWRLPS
jgi:hypothetical protein